MLRLTVGIAALTGAVAVVLAALRAHALPGRLDPASLAMVDSASTMAGWHALALIAVAALGERLPRRPLAWAIALFITGLVLFCGSVLTRALLGLSLGPLAPIGGVALIGGWLVLAYTAFVARR